MLLSFQACPDVQGTESTGKPLTEQLTSEAPNSNHYLYYSRRIDVLGGMERWKCEVPCRTRFTQSRHVKRRAISMFRVRENQQQWWKVW
jgi:hypothetical protein